MTNIRDVHNTAQAGIEKLDEGNTADVAFFRLTRASRGQIGRSLGTLLDQLRVDALELAVSAASAHQESVAAGATLLGEAATGSENEHLVNAAGTAATMQEGAERFAAGARQTHEKATELAAAIGTAIRLADEMEAHATETVAAFGPEILLPHAALRDHYDRYRDSHGESA